MPAITPFTIAIPQSDLDDLHQRLDMARWPEREAVGDWSQGVPLAALQDFVGYWRHGYDWRRCEAMLNGFDQFKTEIDGLDVHFIHLKSPNPDALPLIVTHGWPGSVIEFMKVLRPLADPAAFGGDPKDAFHVIAPSLPGYGFSGKPAKAGWGVAKIAAAWAELMARLGYEKWVAQGGDWGAAITSAIGMQAPDGCAAIHVNMPIAGPSPEDMANLTDREKRGLAAMDFYQKWDSGYSKQQSTRPQTVGYGLTDSPVGQAAWIYEKMYAWTDNQGAPEDSLGRDQMLDNIMLYWLPGNAASSARLYWESFGSFSAQPIHIPMGVSVFPKEIFRPSRRWAERTMHNLIHWNEPEKGGHFAAWEQPDLWLKEVRDCFRLVR